MNEFSNRLIDLVHSLEAKKISTCDIELADGEVLRLRFRCPEEGSSRPVFDSTTTEHQAVVSNSTTIRSDGMGYFFRQYPLSEPADTNIAVSVSKDEIVGYLQIGEVVRPVVSSVAGLLTAPLIADGQLVGYGDELFSLELVL